MAHFHLLNVRIHFPPDSHCWMVSSHTVGRFVQYIPINALLGALSEKIYVTKC